MHFYLDFNLNFYLNFRIFISVFLRFSEVMREIPQRKSAAGCSADFAF